MSAAVRTTRLLGQIAPQTVKGVRYQSLSKGEKRALFLEYFKRFSAELLEELDGYEMPEETQAYIGELMEYTIPGGKLNRGLSVLSAYSHLVGNRALSESEVVRAAVLGWAIEWLQAFLLVADDVMDASETRRGQPCWYKVEGVGIAAINDAFILESGVYRLLKRYFGEGSQGYDPELYVRIVDMFHEVTYLTELGQALDIATEQGGDGDSLDHYTTEKQSLTLVRKTAHYSFQISVFLGMLLVGMVPPADLLTRAGGSTVRDFGAASSSSSGKKGSDAEAFREARDILQAIGLLFQHQDDFLDYWQDPEILGKVGTDIESKKNSWPVVTFLSLASASDRALLEANYGRDDASCVAIVKNLYRKYDIESIFRKYEHETITSLRSQIAAVKSLPPAVFSDFLDKIAYREK